MGEYPSAIVKYEEDTQTGVNADVGQFPVVHRAVQPPIGFELMRIISPNVFVSAILRRT